MRVRVADETDGAGWRLIVDEDGASWGAWHAEVNVLAPGGEDTVARAPEVARLVVWSGWLGDTMFERGVRTWGPAGMEAFNERMRTVVGTARERGARVLIRPHARHVVSDPQRCLSMARADGGFGVEGVGVAMDVAAMLEGGMASGVEDHAARSLMVGGAVAEAVWMTEGREAGEDDGPEPGTVQLPEELVEHHLGAAGPQTGDDEGHANRGADHVATPSMAALGPAARTRRCHAWKSSTSQRA